MSIIPQIKDNVYGQLGAIVQTSSVNIVLQSGEGARFPQPITASATSAGTSTTLNSTGIGASGIVVGDVIVNLTDSTSISDEWSVAVVRTVSTDSITTSPLRGGSDNTWSDGDSWCVNPIMVNLSSRTGGVITGAKTAFEKVLVTARSTDTLTMPQTSGYRGKDGTTIQEFGVGSFVTIEVDQSFGIGLKKLLTSLLAQPEEVGQLVQTVGDQTVAGVKTFGDDSARSATDAAPVDETSFANKKYVDDNSGAETVGTVFKVLDITLTNTTVITFTHNLNVTEVDVRDGRYFITWFDSLAGAGTFLKFVGPFTVNNYDRQYWNAGNPTVATQLFWQENTLKLYGNGQTGTLNIIKQW